MEQGLLMIRQSIDLFDRNLHLEVGKLFGQPLIQGTNLIGFHGSQSKPMENEGFCIENMKTVTPGEGCRGLSKRIIIQIQVLFDFSQKQRLLCENE